MLSAAAKIRAEIQMLEQARYACTDSGIRSQIDVFLEAHHAELERLTSQKQSQAPFKDVRKQPRRA